MKLDALIQNGKPGSSLTKCVYSNRTELPTKHVVDQFADILYITI
jgi:hypothetical protein